MNLELWARDIISTVLLPSGFVDANALSFLWLKEFDQFRICFISGPLTNPIFCCFESNIKNKNELIDIIIRCDGSHFTLLKPVAGISTNQVNNSIPFISINYIYKDKL